MHLHQEMTATARDWVARTANTLVLIVYGLLASSSAALSLSIDPRITPLRNGRDMDRDVAQRLLIANATVDILSVVAICVFFVLNRKASKRKPAVYAQVAALVLCIGSSIGLGIPIQGAQGNIHDMFFITGMVTVSKAGAALCIIAFVGTYTSIHYGARGWRRPFAPHAEQDTAGKANKRDRGAQIAQIVLLSFLGAYLPAAFAVSILLAIPGLFESYFASEAWVYSLTSGVNPAAIAHVVVMILFAVYIAWYLFGRVAFPTSRIVSVRTDLTVMSIFTLCDVVAGAVAIAISTNKELHSGVLGGCLGLVSAGFSLVIIVFEAAYTAKHSDGRKAWHRRFATPAAASRQVQHDELDGKDPVSEESATLSYA